MCLGQTLDGRDMHYVNTGTGERKWWIIHRQHPVETMVEFYGESLLNRQLGLDTNGSIDGMTCDIFLLFPTRVLTDPFVAICAPTPTART